MPDKSNDTNQSEVLRDESGRFLKGTKPANPYGRPKKEFCLSYALSEALKEVDPKTGLPVFYALIEQIVKDAKSRNPKIRNKALNDIWDRLEGKPTQTQEITGEDGEAVKIVVLDM